MSKLDDHESCEVLKDGREHEVDTDDIATLSDPWDSVGLVIQRYSDSSAHIDALGGSLVGCA